ncbi:TRAP transporter substrate-binding protein [Paeniroseomonas aquatica]|uniref:TRAP transporter substrate-binding protein n=1 Tax=Paeniroseomonas aquatica TaxID=373043 RepID=A0ABT8A991_9PROT|nr:TRAP transporter substrate-binding protein [Paeniroseomonas aquatica]MDN3566099.1 TRAP transporter substrate-binding protein [Paeniroseomonas aquatica]
MDRRGLFAGAAAAGAVALSTPALAQGALPEIRWRCASSFPKSLDTIYGAGEHVGKRVAALTDGKFQIRTFAAGELVPGLAVADAVQTGTVDCAHTASYYFVGKDPTFAFDGAVPFGLNMRQNNAWLQAGGGREVLKEFFDGYNIVSIPAGNTGAQMGGWFRKEIKTVEDLRGLKFRVGGFAGNVLQKLGVVPQQIAGGDIYPALEKGTIDAAEWIGPYDDEKLGFNRVAPFYYYPGWWEGSLNLSFYINKAKYEELPQLYKDVLESACRDSTIETMAKYDVQNPPALRRLVAAGTQLRAFPREVMQACYKATFELYDETAARNPAFKKVYEPWRAFRDSQYQWFRVAESGFDNFGYFMHAQEQQRR